MMKKVLACLLVLACAYCSRSESNLASSPNIVILLIDSLRADSLHDYGSSRNTNPFLAEFGRKGIRFAKAYSHSSHTKLSVASLFTGMTPPEHKVRRATHPFKNEVQSDSLSKHLTTLAEVFKKKGYRTGAFVTNPHITPRFGFAQGFNDFSSYPWLKTNARVLNNEAIKWLRAAPSKPFFLYLHYMDIHSPYNPPAKYRFLYTKKKNIPLPYVNGPWKFAMSQVRVDYTRAFYDAQVNYWDECFRQFISRMKKNGCYDNTLFIILSDHGEEFFEHGGFGHGVTLYDEQLHVPLYMVLEGPIPPAQVRTDPIQILDLFPTVCELAHRNIQSLNLAGINLLGPNNHGKNNSRTLYAETFKGKIPRAVQSERYKMIYNSQEKEFESYDLEQDPEEKKNIIAKANPELERLKAALFQTIELAKKGVKSKSKKLDQNTVEQLKSLGYIK